MLLLNIEDENNSHKDLRSFVEAKVLDMMYVGIVSGNGIKPDANPSDIMQSIDLLIKKFESQEAYEKCNELKKVKQKYEEHATY
jgi:hypothetical protein